MMAVFVLSFLSPKTATPSHELRLEGDAGEEGLLLGHGAAMRLVASNCFRKTAIEKRRGRAPPVSLLTAASCNHRSAA